MKTKDYIYIAAYVLFFGFFVTTLVKELQYQDQRCEPTSPRGPTAHRQQAYLPHPRALQDGWPQRQAKEGQALDGLDCYSHQA